MSDFTKHIDTKEGKLSTFFKSSDVRLIVFDLHGTITNRTSIHPYHINYRNRYIENSLGRPFPEDFSGGTDEAFALFPELDKNEFYRHRDNDPLFQFAKIHAPNPVLAKKLRAITSSFRTILYTDSYLKQIERTLIAIGISNIFDKIIGIENGHRKSISQHTVYPQICEKYGIGIQNLLIVGDRMDKDINPVLRAGGNGLRIASQIYILDALEIINKTFANKT